jgi:hypothetical protein
LTHVKASQKYLKFSDQPIWLSLSGRVAKDGGRKPIGENGDGRRL